MPVGSVAGLMKGNNVDLFRFWLSEGYKFRKRSNVDMQRDPKAYKERLKMEYDVIVSIEGYVDYFLMVSDIVRWAKDRNIAVGPGRGSAAGSLCCYLLRITELDPLQYPMLFERFVSRDRTDLPDIDIDFEDERRSEVVSYAQQKYGYDRVADIITFTRYKGANSLNDIGTVYRIPEWTINQIKEKLPERQDGHPRFSDTLRDTIDENDDVADFVKLHPEIELATFLEGNYRHTSIHPAACVISSVPITDISAVYEKQSGTDRGSGIAYDKKDSEYLGLLKMDFLSLKTLTGIRASLDALGMSITDLYELPLNDPKVYEAFRRADVLGIFQFEGHTTKRVLKAVAPTKFMDLVDVNALSRPGGDDQAYIKNKREGNLGVAENHETLYEHLAWTHGTIVYQEQILLILRDLGNFEPAALNSVRKAISAKKDVAEFNVYRDQFVDGAATHDMSSDEALHIWHLIVAASGYAFNISHAACYTDTAYRQMWLKVHHPEFYLGQLQKCPDDDNGREKRRRLITEAGSKGIQVYPPNLEVSKQNWVLHQGHLYAGFTAVKGIGPKMADKIVAWRDSHIQADGEVWHKLPLGENASMRTALDWDDLIEVPGIGEGRIKTIKDFVYHDDPFEVNKVKRALDAIRHDFDNGALAGVPEPTHRSPDLSADEYVVFMGVLKGKHYRDLITQRLKYGPEGLTREKILEDLEDPHLLKYIALEVVDEFDEPIRIRVGRKKYPQYKALLSAAREDHDVILAKGYVSEFGGLGIQIQELFVIDPE